VTLELAGCSSSRTWEGEDGGGELIWRSVTARRDGSS
jgi:hypothetical protein